jgi:aerobic carbon-monoxide dehydrogenase small subunit
MSEIQKVSLWVVVNGVVHEEMVDPRLLLSDYLRINLGLTGTHVGCEHGVCGSCTVLIDGASARSCLMLAIQANGLEINTVESLGSPEKLNPLQKAFNEHHGLQCGFCTPGMLMTATEMLQKYPLKTDEEIRELLSGNLCRCTGYQGIIDAVRQCARQRDAGEISIQDISPRIENSL